MQESESEATNEIGLGGGVADVPSERGAARGGREPEGEIAGGPPPDAAGGAPAEERFFNIRVLRGGRPAITAGFAHGARGSPD